MNDFIEIDSCGNQILINLNFITSITQNHNHYIKSDYLIYLVNGKCYEIDKKQYEMIKAKLIDNNSKE